MANMTPEQQRQYESFIRHAVETVSRYQDDGKALTLTPEDKVSRVKRTADAFIKYTDDFPLNEQSAVMVAAVVVAAEEDHWKPR